MKHSKHFVSKQYTSGSRCANSPRQPKRLPRGLISAIATTVIVVFLCIGRTSFSQQAKETFQTKSLAVGQNIVSVTEPRSMPISVSGDEAARWKQGNYDIWHLRGNVFVAQGDTTVTANETIIWSEKAEPEKQIPAKLIVYVEGQKAIVTRKHSPQFQSATGKDSDRIETSKWLGRFYSDFGVQFNLPIIGEPPKEPPAIFQRAIEERKLQTSDNIAPAQFQEPINQLQPLIAPAQDNPQLDPRDNSQMNPRFIPASRTKIEFRPRSKNPLNQRAFPSPDGSEEIILYTGGVRVSIEGDRVSQFSNGIMPGNSNGNMPASDRVTIEADSVIAWTNPLRQLLGNKLDDSEKRWEVYLEGNIVFSTDDRVVYAEQMYYDVQLKRGTILDAEMYTPVPGYEGMLRLKADVLQQVDENNVRAYGSSVTSSRIGVPRYWLQSETLDLNRRPQLEYNEFGQIQFDPTTGQPESAWSYDGTSRNNTVYILGMPVFYWPSLNGNSNQGSYYISGLAVKNDNVFGFQTYTKWDVFQLFGIAKPPQNTEWDLNLDYLSDRGFGFGTEASYNMVDPYGPRTLNKGIVDAWGIFDEGVDNLGRDRRQLVPEEDFRGRLLWQHRNRFANGIEFTAEVGLVSDRNFLEQYREREWDENKDQITGLQLKKLWGNQSFNVSANVRTNDFFTQNNQLPSLNYFLLGQSFLNDRLTWSTQTNVGYNKLQTADAPIDPVDAAKFDPLAWETPREGINAASRHEISMPIQTGLIKTTPYVLGEAAFYGEDINGNSLNRTFGQAGIRFSLPMAKFNPYIQDPLFNISGIVHKVEWEADLFFAEASEDLDQLPLYNKLDDDAQEHFRRRFFFDSFGGVPGGNVPLRFDERNFAFRNGMQSNVTAASSEIVDDLAAARFGVNQRWQTKRGPAGDQKIIDWIVLDMHGTFFPKDDRDNFGESLGVVDYDFRWHVGDRLTLMSDAYADLFSEGLKMISVGARLTRPEVGNLYVGLRSIEGPISANVLNAQINHRLDEKWAMSLGTSIDFGASGNLGQRFAVSRIGESAIIRAGVNVDVSRGTTGFNFLILPRFIPKKSLRRTIGVEIAPLGSRGIE